MRIAIDETGNDSKDESSEVRLKMGRRDSFVQNFGSRDGDNNFQPHPA